MPIDLTLFATAMALVVLGLWMVLDASYVKTLDNPKIGFDAFYYVKRQAIGAGVGLFALFVLMWVGWWNLRRCAVVGMVVGLVLLCAVKIPHIGVINNGAARWVKLGPIGFQPSELAKVLLVLYIAAVLSRPHCDARKPGAEGLLPALIVSGLTLLLIEREPDLGTAIVLFLAVLTQLYLAGARTLHLGTICGCTALVILLIGFGGHGLGHRQNRIISFLHPEQDKKGLGFQVYHSRLAIGSGQWIGEGMGRGREKYYLPQGNSDFIFATYAEETGLLGCLVLIGLMGLVGWRGFRIAAATQDRFGMLLAAGIASVISWQALINMAVATGSIPATGVPLPFISDGSTSLVLLLAGVGILLSIAQHPIPPTAMLEK
jgi:cell division protein FtsW